MSRRSVLLETTLPVVVLVKPLVFWGCLFFGERSSKGDSISVSFSFVLFRKK